jgi:hypothetical protein
MKIKLHHQALIDHRNSLYYGLIYPNHVNTADRVVKYREFYEVEDGRKVYTESSDGKQKLKIYSMECDIYCLPNGGFNELYALSKEQIDKLPIKIRPNGTKPMFLRKEDRACNIVEECASFRIAPAKLMELKELAQAFISPHSQPEEYELYVITALSMLLGRGACWISTNPAFGKSGLLKTFNMLFDGVPVNERVRTVPAIYKHIPEDGILVIDEMAKKDSESSENLLYALNIIGDVNESRIVMNTGGSAAYGTNVPKSLRNTSIMCLMNRVSDYETPEKFAEFMFSNNAALDRRFLKLRPMDGNLDMGYFSDWKNYTPEEKEYLKQMAKTIAYYKPHIVDGQYVAGYKLEANQKMVSNAIAHGERTQAFQRTHIATVRLILEVLSIYCKDDYIKFSTMSERLYAWIKRYNDMISTARGDETDDDVSVSGQSQQKIYKQPDSVSFQDKGENKAIVTASGNKVAGDVIRMKSENKSLADLEQELL